MNKTIILLLYILTMPQYLWATDLPLEASKWNVVKYSSIPQNDVLNIEDGLEISVHHSSSALVYKFKEVIKVQNIKIRATLIGDLNYKGKSPGDKSADDFPLRLGLVLKGNNQLNFFQKTIAPDWLIKLNKMASSFGGFDKINSLIFYTTRPSFEKREHPLSSYFLEEIGGQFNNNVLNIKHSYSVPKEVIGLWLSSDGDDTKSSFKVIIEEINLNFNH